MSKVNLLPSEISSLPDHGSDLLGDLLRTNGLVYVNQSQVFQLGKLLEGALDIVHVCLVVLGVMNVHSFSIDVWLEGIVAVRQRRQLGERHDRFLYSQKLVQCVCLPRFRRILECSIIITLILNKKAGSRFLPNRRPTLGRPDQILCASARRSTGLARWLHGCLNGGM